eukprot:2892719-Pyramimonas_sp.AAC.1
MGQAQGSHMDVLPYISSTHGGVHAGSGLHVDWFFDDPRRIDEVPPPCPSAGRPETLRARSVPLLPGVAFPGRDGAAAWGAPARLPGRRGGRKGRRRQRIRFVGEFRELRFWLGPWA